MSNPSTPSADDCETIDILASDFLARYRDGERPTVEEYARRHPEFSDSIRRIFPLVASIERVKINDQVADDGSATLAGRVLSQLGDFRIVREIGRGGMGIVFEAHQESLDRIVAIKVLPKQSLLDDEALQSFRREATTAAAMHHSNIVPIYGSGESDGAHYLVMQLVRGDSLDNLIATAPEFPSNEVAQVGVQVADAIAYAHSNGVLHRDIKPANILIDDGGTAQVTDFGLARDLNKDVTQNRAVSGSLRYMAPERFAGISGEASDVYGIGITLYELLARQPAFQASDPEHLIGLISTGQVKPIRAIRAEVPIDLATIVGKAIHVDPSQRYPSAAELRDDLRRFLADEPIHARRTSVLGRFVRWVRRNPKLAVAIGTAAFALIAASIVSTIAFLVTAAANQRSVEALRSSKDTVDLALQSLDGVVEIVSQSTTSANLANEETFNDGLLPNVDIEPSPTSAQVLERLQPIYERLSQQSPTRSDIILQRVDSSIQLARIQHSLGRISDSIQTLNSSVALLTEREESLSIPIADFQLRLARLNNELGASYASEYQKEQSSQCYAAAIEAASQLDSMNVAGRTELARAYLSLGNRPPQMRRDESPTPADRETDLAHINSAIQILEELRETQKPTKSTNILYASGLSARSRLITGPKRKQDDFDAAVAVIRDHLNQSPLDAAVRFELVQTLADVNLRGSRPPRQYSLAAERLGEALQEIKTLRSGNPDNAVYLATEVHLRHKLSAIARTQSRFEEAEVLLSDAIRLQTLLMQTRPDSLQHLCWRAMLYRSQANLYRQWNKPEVASESIAKAASDLDAVDPQFADHPFVIRARDAIHEFTDADTGASE